MNAAQVQAVPQASALPQGMRWTLIRATSARKDGKYIYVRREDKKTNSNRKLSGAERYWNSTKSAKEGGDDERSLIYVPAYAITGTPADVYEALVRGNPPISPADAKAAVEGAITRNNYQSTHADLYNSSIGVKAAPVKVNWAELQWMTRKSNRVDTIIVGDNNTTHVVSKTGGSDPLRTRFNTLAKKNDPSKMIDVSNLDLNTWKGYENVDRNAVHKRGGFVSADLPFTSNNADKFVAAIEHIYGPEGRQAYAKAIADLTRHLTAAATVSSSNFAAPGAMMPQGFPTMADARPVAAAPFGTLAAAPAVSKRPSVASPPRASGVPTMNANGVAAMPSMSVFGQ